MIPLGHTSIKIIVFNTLFFFIFLYFKFNLLIFLIRSYLDSGGVKGKVNIFFVWDTISVNNLWEHKADLYHSDWLRWGREQNLEEIRLFQKYL